MQIKYEPHPVTPERKLELRSQGYKIIDERFKPYQITEAAQTNAKEQAIQHEAEAKAQAEAPSAPALKPRGRPRKGK
jgi:hypothetical protein